MIRIVYRICNLSQPPLPCLPCGLGWCVLVDIRDQLLWISVRGDYIQAGPSWAHQHCSHFILSYEPCAHWMEAFRIYANQPAVPYDLCVGIQISCLLTMG